MQILQFQRSQHYWPTTISKLELLVTPNAVISSLILSNLMTEAIYSSKTSVLITATRRHIPEDGIFQYLLNAFTSISLIYHCIYSVLTRM
jgi:hypothetical protein